MMTISKPKMKTHKKTSTLPPTNTNNQKICVYIYIFDLLFSCIMTTITQIRRHILYIFIHLNENIRQVWFCF